MGAPGMGLAAKSRVNFPHKAAALSVLTLLPLFKNLVFVRLIEPARQWQKTV